MTKVFIFCLQIQNQLTLLAEDLSKAGISVDMSVGESGKTTWQYRRSLFDAVDKCDIVIVGFSKLNSGDDFNNDIISILERERYVIPVKLDNSSFDISKKDVRELFDRAIHLNNDYSLGFNQILNLINVHSDRLSVHNRGNEDTRKVNILPKRVRGFINREEDIQEISAQLLQREFVQIRGLGGIGKTSLAIEIAHRLKDHFKHGVLWISALDSPSADDILNSIGMAFKFEVSAMPTTQKKFFLKIELANLDYLIIIDNVQDLDSVTDIYDLAANGAILCTSRPQIILPIMNIFDLSVLEKEHAIRLFQDIYGQHNYEGDDNQIVEDICVEKLDGYPLAIELAAKQANIQKLTIQKLATRLDKTLILPLGLPSLGSITTSLLSTIDQLPGTARDLFVALGVFAGRTIDKIAIEFILQNNEIEEMIYNLQGYSLISTEQDRVLLHPLVKELATHQARQNQDLFIRMVEYYVDYTDKYSNEHLEIEKERINIEGAVVWAFNNQRYGLMVSIVDNLLGADAYYSYWAMRGYWGQGINILRKAIEACRFIDDAYKEARYNLELGLFLYWLGDHKNARMVGKNAENIFEKIDSTKELIRTCWLQGYIEDDEDNYESANKLYRRSLKLSTDIQNKVLEVTSMELVGVNEYHQGNYETARDFLENSLLLSKTEGYKAGISRGQRRLAAVARLQGSKQNNQANRTDFLKEARNLLQDCLATETNQRSRARALRQLGMVDLMENEFRDAEIRFKECLDIFIKLGNRRGIAATYYNLGEFERMSGNLEDARSYFNQSLEIAREINAKMGIAVNLRQLSLIAKEQGHIEESQELLNDSITLLSQINSPYLNETMQLRK